MQNKIVGTNFIKSKYVITELTVEDIAYLKEQGIFCHRVKLPYYSRYLFTGFKKVNKFIMNTFSKADLQNELLKIVGKSYTIEIPKKIVTMQDLIKYITFRVNLDELIKSKKKTL